MSIEVSPRVAVLLSRLTAARANKLDNLDALISSRAPAATALSNLVWTDERAAKLDNLDATISSRAPAATALSNLVWTDARAAKLDNLDATISSRAPADTALSNLVWTDARAAKLDYLDVAISTRAPAATALSNTVWTDTRAAYLDNLISHETAGVYSHPSGTTEQDAVVITPTELSQYYKLVMDLSALTQITYIRVYIMTDGVNYRQSDYAEYPTDFPTGTKNVVISLLPTAKAIKVTLQSAVAEGVARSIPYFYVRKSEA